jgi:hypothetical protein
VYRGSWQGTVVACKKMKHEEKDLEFEAEVTTLQYVPYGTIVLVFINIFFFSKEI